MSETASLQATYVDVVTALEGAQKAPGEGDAEKALRPVVEFVARLKGLFTLVHGLRLCSFISCSHHFIW